MKKHKIISSLIVSASLVFVTLLMLTSPSADLDDFKDYRFRKPVPCNIPAGKIKVTYLGVATLLIDDGETQLLTDGFVTRPSFTEVAFSEIGCDTLLVKKMIDRLKMHRLKAVFAAHSHYDHAMDAPYFAFYTKAILYGSSSTLNIGKGAKLTDAFLREYKPGKAFTIGKFTITVLHSKHTRPVGWPAKDNTGEEISKPFSQPAKLEKYTEGGAYDFLIRHGEHSLLIKASTNFLPQAFDSIKADVLFLGVALLSKQDRIFQNEFYQQTAGKLKPKLIIPIHWDNFFKPLNSQLVPYGNFVDDVRSNFDFLIRKTTSDSIQFGIMQGFESLILF